MGTFIATLVTVIVAAWLTAQFAARRFYRERWWDKKYDAYMSVLNSLHTILQNFSSTNTFFVYDDGLGLDEKTKKLLTKAEKSHENYQSSRAELRRISDIGEFIISPAALNEIDELSRRFVSPKKGHDDEHYVALEQSIQTCLNKIRQHARDDLNPSVLKSLQRLAAGISPKLDSMAGVAIKTISDARHQRAEQKSPNEASGLADQEPQK